MTDATDLRAMADQLIASIPPDLDIGDMSVNEVDRDTAQRYCDWMRATERQLLDAAHGDIELLREAAGPRPDLGTPFPGYALLWHARTWAENLAKPTPVQAAALARQSLWGLPADAGTYTPEAATMARTLLPVERRRQSRDTVPDGWPLLSVEQAERCIDEYEERTRAPSRPSLRVVD